LKALWSDRLIEILIANPSKLHSRQEVDEDIHTLDPSPPHKDNHAIAATKGSNDEIRIGPITRARAKLIQQQVNSLLIESDFVSNENQILPKSLYVCMIRFMGEKDNARGSEELQHEELAVLDIGARAREEREDGATAREDQPNTSTT
jgi:hypothetical protein